MYAATARTMPYRLPRFRYRGGRRIQSSASEQCSKGCSFSDVPLDCIKYLKLGDPACGSGNFLTETYISLRRLENKVISALHQDQIVMGDALDPIKVSISQFHGIEINDFAETVAKTALWIAESQMMKATEEIVNQPLEFLPLKTNADIIRENALVIPCSRSESLHFWSVNV